MKLFYSILTSILLMSTISLSHAQQVNRICGHDLMLDQARTQVPDFDAQYDEIFQTAKQIGALSREDDTTLVIPVVFHILYEEGDPYQNVSDELIHSQLAALNRDFNKRNADTVDTREVFKQLHGVGNIKFVLAKKVGEQCKDAIIRKARVTPNPFVPILMDLTVKDDLFGGSTAWNTNKYLNIWVTNLNPPNPDQAGFLGGYAFLPGYAQLLGVPKAWDGVVIDYRFFGEGNPYIPEVEPGFSRYGRGRTTVHEVGHWLGLRHIWGDLGSLNPELGCTSDDGVEDTPNAQVAYSTHGFCEDTIVNSCDDGPGDLPDMFENYMDYSSDDCNTMFTIGQMAVSRGVLRAYRVMTPIDYQAPTTSAYTETIIEGDDVTICFDLEDCFSYVGSLESWFCEEDSSYTSSMGNAELIGGQVCINYEAGVYDEGNDVDEFCVVTHNAQFNEYDTTLFTVTITERCPKPESVEIDILENTTETVCVELDACLGSSTFTVAPCSGAGTTPPALVDATVNGLCFDIAAPDYDAADHSDLVCVVATVDGSGVTDTTYIEVTINEDPATGIEIISDEMNTLDIFPNPTSGVFSIVSSPVNEDLDITVYNPLGEVVRKSKFTRGSSHMEMDLGGNATGVYLIYFEGKESSTYEKVLLK
ncbi:MAG: T9SS type A sorting domain-containing protein [Bacteroidetes bacterium]|nr:T9SS type A sorting domain-containing protein [Bacteroidota bacterium]